MVGMLYIKTDNDVTFAMKENRKSSSWNKV